MRGETAPLLDAALVDTVADGEELIIRAQAIAHETEERLHALTGADPCHAEQASWGSDSAGPDPAARAD